LEKEINRLFAEDDLKIVQRKDHLAFSIDSVLLSNFVQATARIRKIIDFGTGYCPIPLFLSKRTKATIDALEIQEEAANLAKESVELNALEDQIHVLHMDVREAYQHLENSSYDIAVCNPPFFKLTHEKVQNELDSFTIARHEKTLTLDDMVIAAKRLLVTGGSLVCIHRVDRMEEIILTLTKHRFAIKRMQYVYPKKGKKALMVLIDAKSNSPKGSLHLLEPFYIYENNGKYTEEVQKLFHTDRS